MQLTFGRSIDPIVPLDLSITRVAVTREEDAQVVVAEGDSEASGGKQTEMGRKAVVPYGLYRAYGFFNPHFGKQTGVTEEDLGLLWQAVLARAAQPEAERADFNLYLDEFQNYLHLPQSLDEVLVEARGYHLGLVLANQHLGQLSSTTREALSANARTRVFFQCGQEDARYLAREFEPHLNERHLRNLQRFQVAARLCVDGRTQPPCTGLTRPSPPSLGAANRSRLIETSLSRCGRPRQVIEAELERRLEAFQPGPVESAE